MFEDRKRKATCEKFKVVMEYLIRVKSWAFLHDSHKRKHQREAKKA